MNVWINSPLEQFTIRTYLGINTPFIDTMGLNITNYSIYMLIITLIIIYIHIISIGQYGGIIPTRWSIGIESLYLTINNMVKNQISYKYQYYFPLIYVIFILILVSNILSIIPYNFAIMAQLIYTISLSSILWIGITIIGLYKHRLNFFSLFVPAGCSLPLLPLLVIIELLSYSARSISLGLRLGSNILAGHLLMVILCSLVYDFISSSIIFFIIGIIPLIIILSIMCLESAIAAIQAYVFCILACSYIKDTLYLH